MELFLLYYISLHRVAVHCSRELNDKHFSHVADALILSYLHLSIFFYKTEQFEFRGLVQVPSRGSNNSDNFIA